MVFLFLLPAFSAPPALLPKSHTIEEKLAMVAPIWHPHAHIIGEQLKNALCARDNNLLTISGRAMIEFEKSSKLNIDRRVFTFGGVSALGLTLAGCSSSAQSVLDGVADMASGQVSALSYGPLPNEQFPLAAADLSRVPAKYLRRRVSYQTREPVGSIIVDTKNFYAYLVEPDGKAMRYGVGLGRAGFAWSGRANIAWKRKWPTWTPPAAMIARQPELEKYSAANGGMKPGLNNPLGARALYIFQNGRDTLYRLHGTTENWSIGKAVSSGCVRFINHDIIDLYKRVRSNAKIVVI